MPDKPKENRPKRKIFICKNVTFEQRRIIWFLIESHEDVFLTKNHGIEIDRKEVVEDIVRFPHFTIDENNNLQLWSQACLFEPGFMYLTEDLEEIQFADLVIRILKRLT